MAHVDSTKSTYKFSNVDLCLKYFVLVSRFHWPHFCSGSLTVVKESTCCCPPKITFTETGYRI